MSEAPLATRDPLAGGAVPVSAGPVTGVLLDGDLRTLTVGGVEIVRRIYVAVRDLDWNTIEGTVEESRIEHTAGGFRFVQTSRHTAQDIDVRIAVEAVGEPDGSVSYRMHAAALRAFAYAKIGICVHHPVRGFAGHRYVASTPGGTVRGDVPVAIGPQIHLPDGTDAPLWDPFSTLDMTHESGATIHHRFTGNLWEIEDQRNWTDANYKSASTPAYLGYHHEARETQVWQQSVTVTSSGFPSAPAALLRGPIELSVGDPTGTVMPSLGVEVTGRSGDESAVRLLRPGHVRVNLDTQHPDRFAAAREAAGASRLEVALMLHGDRAIETAAVRDLLASIDARVARLLVLHADEESTAPATVAAVRRVLGPVPYPVITGTDYYFNQLNRHRFPLGDADGATWTINPQIHAFDDLSIMETLEAHADQARTARVFLPEGSLHVSPVTLRPRFNAVAVTSDGRGAIAPDPRQHSMLTGAWTLGSIAKLAAAGVASVTYFEASGPKGVVDDHGETSPAFHVLHRVSALQGAEVLTMHGVVPDRVAAVAVATDDGARALVANLSPDPIELVVEGHRLHLQGYDVAERDIARRGTR